MCNCKFEIKDTPIADLQALPMEELRARLDQALVAVAQNFEREAVNQAALQALYDVYSIVSAADSRGSLKL